MCPLCTSTLLRTRSNTWPYITASSDLKSQLASLIANYVYFLLSAEKNLEELSSLGHFLKGSSATLGFNKVRDNCQIIQQYGHKQTVDGADEPDEEVCLTKIKEAVKTVKTDFADLEKDLKTFFEPASITIELSWLGNCYFYSTTQTGHQYISSRDRSFVLVALEVKKHYIFTYSPCASWEGVAESSEFLVFPTRLL